MKPPRHELKWLAIEILRWALCKFQDVINNDGKRIVNGEEIQDRVPELNKFLWACSFCTAFANMEHRMDCSLCPLRNPVVNNYHGSRGCCNGLYELWYFGDSDKRKEMAEKVYKHIQSFTVGQIIDALDKLPDEKLWKLLLLFGRAM